MKPSEPCASCGTPVDVTKPSAVIEFVGWAPRARRGGGLNRLFARRETGRVLCFRCFSRLQTGLDVEQGQLV